MLRSIGGFIISMALVAMMGGVALAQGPANPEINATYWGNDSAITHENLAGMALEDLGILPGHYDVWESTGPIPAGAMRTKRGIVLVPITASRPASGIIRSDGRVALAQGPAKPEISEIRWGNDSEITHENVAGMEFEDLGILPGHYDVWHGTGAIPVGAMRTKRGVVLVPVPVGTPTSGIIQSDGSVIPFAEVF